MKTVCLITPPSAFLMDERVFAALGILKVAASLERHGYAVEHLDLCGVTNYEDAVRDHAARSEAEVFGITATTPQMPAAVRIARVLTADRGDERRVILGGPHATLTWAAAKRERKNKEIGRATKAMSVLSTAFDVVVAGDGELAILDAVDDRLPPCVIDADDPDTHLFMTKQDVEQAPWPARHLVDMDSYHYTIDVARACSLIAQLGCPFACAFCLSGDTRVFTREGPIRLDKLTAAREVATPLGAGMATDVFYSGNKDTFRVTIEGGLSIKGTADHKIMCVDGESFVWKRVEQITANDFVVIRRPDVDEKANYIPLTRPTLPDIPPGGFLAKDHHKMPEVLDEKLAWLAGFVVGDGSIPSDNRPSFHVCITDELRDKIKEVIAACFDVGVAESRAEGTDKMWHGWVHSRLAREVLVQSLGIDTNNKLRIPKIFWESPLTVLSAFVEGLMDADGYLADKNPYLVTASQELAEDVAYALLRLGRGCPSVRRIERPNELGPGISYRVNVLKNDRIPCQRALYKSSKSGLWYWRTPRHAKMHGLRRRTIRASGLNHPLDRDGWFYAKVVSVKPAAFREAVYDITVPSEEAFVANGFIAHNCGGRASPMLRRIRTRSTENIVAEMRHLYETYGFTGFMFYDDELNVNKQVVGLMDAIAAEGKRLGVEWKLRGFVKAELFTDAQAEAMYRAGFRWLLVGFESGSPRILENINKKATREDNTRCRQICRRHGIKVKALMSLGHAGESPETIRDTKDWLLEQHPDDFDATVITTYPGTPYFDEAVETSPGVWTYTAKNGDRLHAYETDWSKDAAYYKGVPGEYESFVFTDHVSAKELVTLRDELEADVRQQLCIPFNAGNPGVRYEASFGMLPGHLLRRSVVAT